MLDSRCSRCTSLCHQPKCSDCGTALTADARVSVHHHQCKSCHDQRRHSPRHSSPPPSPPPLFPSRDTEHAHLSQLQRAAAAALLRDGQSKKKVAAKLGTTPRTVDRWAARVDEQESVVDARRSGRPRCTDEALDTDDVRGLTEGCWYGACIPRVPAAVSG